MIKDRDTVCELNDDKGIVFMLNKLANDLTENLLDLNTALSILWRPECFLHASRACKAEHDSVPGGLCCKLH